MPLAHLSGIPLSQINNGLSELLRAHRLGKHHLSLERHVVDYFKQHCDLNTREMATLDRVGSEYATAGNAHRTASVYCELVASYISPRTGRTIFLRFDEINEALVGSSGCLIVEHLSTDGFVVEEILSEVRRKSALPAVCLEVCHGGGSAIASCFTNKVAAGRIAACIYDSDASSPNSNLASKRAAFEGIAARSTFAFAAMLPCREAENLVPLETIALLHCAVGCGLTAVLSSVEGWESSNTIADPLHIYVDLKLGLRQDKIAHLKADDAEWLRARLKNAGIDLDTTDCTGFGSYVLHQLSAQGTALRDFRERIRARKWRSLFEDFFIELCWWFAAARPVRT